MIISEIRYNQAIERLRFDAEHYQPKFSESETTLKKAKCVGLNELVRFSKLRKNPENKALFGRSICLVGVAIIIC